ncbi:MAG: PKD domain-containing protein [Halorientalis sp.]
MNVTARPTLVVAGEETVATGEPLTLDASDSTDDGRIARIAWDRGGDGAVDATGETATFAFPDDGTYDIRVTATDDRGVTAVRNHSVVVTNREPTARIDSPREPTVGEAATFDAGGSGDRDGTVERYAWDFDGDGATDATGQRVTHAFDGAGYRTVSLTVTDDDGATDTTAREVYVNAPPEAAAATDGPVKTFETATLSAADSADTDGEITAYEWEIGGRTASGETATVSFPDNGTYEGTLTVTDDDGATDTTAVSLTVRNRVPNATFEYGPAVPTVGEAVSFDATLSSDRDGELVATEWRFGDGTAASGSTVTHTFGTPGNYTVEVRVTDDDGATDTTTREIHVNAPPEAVLDAPRTALTGQEVVLDAANATDPDGEIVDYDWDLAGTADSAGDTAVARFADDGNYTLSVTVTDDHGATDTENVTVRIRNRPPNVTLARVTERTVPGDSVAVAGTTVSLRATATDADGSVDAFALASNLSAAGIDPAWVSQENGTVVAEFTVPLENATDRRFRFTAEDDDGAGSEAVVDVPVNAPPTVEFDAPERATVGEPFTVDSTATDPDGNLTSHKWTVLDGQGRTIANATGETATFEVGYTTTVEVVHRVTDDDGTTRSDGAPVSIEEPNVTVQIQSEQFLNGHLVTLEGHLEGRNDEDVPYESAQWDVGDKSPAVKKGYSTALFADEPINTSARVTFDRGNGTRGAETRVVTEPTQPELTAEWAVGDLLSAGQTCSICVRNGGVEDVVRTDRHVYVLTSNDTAGRVSAVERGTGSVQWTTTVGEAWELVPSSGGILATGYESGVQRLDATTGSVTWTYRANVEVVRVDDGRAFFTEYDQRTDATTLVALDTATGDRMLERTYREYPEVTGTDRGIAVAVNGTLEILSWDGDRLWRTDTVIRNPDITARHGRIYARSYDGNLTVYDEESGDRVREFDQVELVNPTRNGVVLARYSGNGSATVEKWNRSADTREWRQDVRVNNGYSLTTLSVSDGRVALLYEPTDDGQKLLRIDRGTGTVVDRRRSPVEYAYRLRQFGNVTVVGSESGLWYVRDDGSSVTVRDVPYPAVPTSDGLLAPTEQGLVRVTVDRLE